MTTTEQSPAEDAVELKPCPFNCGGRHFQTSGFQCVCNSCGCKGPFGETAEMAASAWNTRTPPAAPADDAVEALAFILAAPEQVELDDQEAKRVISQLSKQGYTLRRETMTEAELEREAFQVALDIWECGAELNGEWGANQCKQWIIDLAKKFRG